MPFERPRVPGEFTFSEKKFLVELLDNIESAINSFELDRINISEINVTPDKLRDGDIINADGTNYNPGSGKGLYFYDGTTLNKL